MAWAGKLSNLPDCIDLCIDPPADDIPAPLLVMDELAQHTLQALTACLLALDYRSSYGERQSGVLLRQ